MDDTERLLRQLRQEAAFASRVGQMERLLVIADGFEAAFAEHDRVVAANAWAEGFDAGHYTGDEPRECECKTNPYLNGDNK